MEISKEQSLRLLKEMCIKRIKTTMIGSLDAIEQGFGAELEKNMDLERQFHEVRKSILDKGNDQIRYLERELDSFEVVWHRYHIYFKKEGQDEKSM